MEVYDHNYDLISISAAALVSLLLTVTPSLALRSWEGPAWRAPPSQCLLVSFAPSDPDELLYAAGISEGFGVLHVLGDDFVQRAADGRHRVV